jgi:hypothetical protein
MRIPPWHFSNFSVQRGTIIQLAGIVAEPPIIGVPIPVEPMPAAEARSIIMVAICSLLWLEESHLPSAPQVTTGSIFLENLRQDNDTIPWRQ